MKWSGSFYARQSRKALPLLLLGPLALALVACSNNKEPQPPLLVDSELGRPLGETNRSGGDVVAERERAQAQQTQRPRYQHPISRAGRAPGAPAASSTVVRNPLGDQPVRLNFVDVDIQAVVRALARSTGQQFLVDPRVKGNLTLVSEGEVPAHQAYDMLLAALRMQGFSVVDVGGVAQVVPEADAKLLGGPIYNAGKPSANGMLTRTFRLQYENAVNLIPVLRPIVSPNNPINAYPGNNSIVITDYAENLTRVAQIIEGIDIPSALDTDVVPVQNGIAVDIAGMVSELLETQGADPTQKVSVVGDPRSNSIIIRTGSPERTELARNLIYKLDNAQSNPSNLHVVYLRNAQAGKLAQALRGLLTGESDSGTGDNARAMLGSMGGMSQGGSSSSGQSGSTSSTSGSSSLSGSSGSGSGYAQGGSSSSSQGGTQASDQNPAFSAGGVTIQADATTNTLLISAPEPLYRNLREVIDMLDQRRAQVVIESLIVEVNEDDAAEFGVQWQTGNLGAAASSVAPTWGQWPQPQRQDQHRRAAPGPQRRPGQRYRGHPRDRQDPRPQGAGPGPEEQGREQRAVDAEPADPGQRSGEYLRRPDHSLRHRQLRHRRWRQQQQPVPDCAARRGGPETECAATDFRGRHGQARHLPGSQQR